MTGLKNLSEKTEHEHRSMESAISVKGRRKEKQDNFV
jgi:hypothetical protein